MRDKSPRESLTIYKLSNKNKLKAVSRFWFRIQLLVQVREQPTGLASTAWISLPCYIYLNCTRLTYLHGPICVFLLLLYKLPRVKTGYTYKQSESPVTTHIS